jgi:hypothetical protein
VDLEKEVELLERKVELMRESIKLTAEIEGMRTQVAKLEWPTRMAGVDRDTLGGGCFS